MTNPICLIHTHTHTDSSVVLVNLLEEKNKTSQSVPTLPFFTALRVMALRTRKTEVARVAHFLPYKFLTHSSPIVLPAV